MNGDQPTKAWTIVRAEPRTMMEGGQTVQGVQVTFRLPDGTLDTIMVPREAFTPEQVAAAVHEQASNHLAVLEQQGPAYEGPVRPNR